MSANNKAAWFSWLEIRFESSSRRREEFVVSSGTKVGTGGTAGRWPWSEWSSVFLRVYVFGGAPASVAAGLFSEVLGVGATRVALRGFSL